MKFMEWGSASWASQLMKWFRNERADASKNSRTLLEHCDFKYLAHLTGRTYSSRIKYLLLCGSVVFASRDLECKEWWYRFLPDDAYVPVHNADFGDVPKKLSALINSRDKGESIAKRGYEFAQQMFTRTSVDCYTYFLIHETVKNLQRTPIEAHDMSVRHIEDVTTVGFNYDEIARHLPK